MLVNVCQTLLAFRQIKEVEQQHSNDLTSTSFERHIFRSKSQVLFADLASTDAVHEKRKNSVLLVRLHEACYL